MRAWRITVTIGAVVAATAGLAAMVRRRARGTRADRTLELVKAGSKAGRNYAAMSLGSAMASDDRKAEMKARFELQTAEQVAEMLGNMKGAVMKLGQMASYLDQGLPEPVREVLAQLQSDAPPMSFELVTQVVRAELGGAPDVVFAEFDRSPLAAASIGQVHRARTHDGVEVAVKVQYPGVDEAIRADLDNADLLFAAMGMMFPGMDPKPIVTELRERISEELDYCVEATNQRRFAAYYEGHPTIRVPRVIDDLSTARVLTSEYATGAKWSEVLTWSPEQKNLVAETIYRYVFTGLYRMGAFNGDPHPGNYLFAPDGKVTFLDYGLVKVFTPDEIGRFAEMIISMCIERDIGRFRKSVEQVGILTDGSRFSDAQVEDYFRHFYELVLDDVTMTITPEYASESLRRFFDLSGPHAEMIKSVNLPSSMVIIQRINLGLYALFSELEATGNWRRLADEIWPFVGAAPASPMGEAIAEWELSRSPR